MSKGTFIDFLARLLAFESGIDPEKHAWYVRHHDVPVMRYPEVLAPGRVVRDAITGEPRFETLTVRQYFERLGVGDLFDAEDPRCLRAMQYRAVNALGFVGYQFGEAILITTEYYHPERVRRRIDGADREYESYYFGGIEPSTWSEGRREVLHRIPGTERILLATDVNRWRGSFTGKGGIRCLDDLKAPEKQDVVMVDVLRSNHLCIEEELARHGESLREIVGRRRPIHPRESATGVEPICTMSGILAAAHLTGARATAAFLRSGTSAQDELGTSMIDYLVEFGGYDIPLD